MPDTMLIFQRRIGSATDRTWEDMVVPEGCTKAVDIMARLRESGIVGVFRVVEEQDECYASTVEFEVKEVRAYEVTELTD